MSTNDIAELVKQRNELAASFNDVANAMRRSSELAASFAQNLLASDAFDTIQNLQQSADSAPTKGKRKAAVEEEPLDGTKKRKRIIKPKDPNAPKRPASSYILFQNDVRKDLKEMHPELNNADLLALISEQWKNMPTEEKNKYNQENKALTQQYSEEKKAYDNRTPEEVEAAKAAAEVALASKKEKAKKAPRSIKPAAVAPAAVPIQARPPPAVETSHSSASEDDSDESDDEESHPTAHPAATSDSSEEESPEPRPKKRRGGSAQPQPPASKSKKNLK